jgi:tetratricopeptide (TPR) repeat protein
MGEKSRVFGRITASAADAISPGRNLAPLGVRPHDRGMTIRIFAVALLCVLMAPTLRAAGPAPLPEAAGLSENAAKERATLFAELAVAKNDADAREIEARIWKFWQSFADEKSRQLLEQSREAQLRFDYAEALLYLKELVKRAPQFAEGWNQLGYVYFLAGQYDASLKTIDQVLELEPMHYAALAGKGIILIQQGKAEEAQAPLKRALAINPWLKERNLIGRDSLGVP